jgi:hypothetical protein
MERRRWPPHSSSRSLSFHSNAQKMIHGIHHAFLVLSGLTVLSTIAFRELISTDRDTVRQHEIFQHAGSRKKGHHPYHPDQRNRGLEASSRRSCDFV